jgi:hypothetical protein
MHCRAPRGNTYVICWFIELASDTAKKHGLAHSKELMLQGIQNRFAKLPVTNQSIATKPFQRAPS